MGYGVTYVDFTQASQDSTYSRYGMLNGYDPVDHNVVSRVNATWYDTPNFIATRPDLVQYNQESKDYFQTNFYIWMRKKHNILLNSEGKPEGGSWTYDTQNRKKLPAGIQIPEYGFQHSPDRKKYIDEAIQYVTSKFPSSPGPSVSSDTFYLPITHEEAESAFVTFLATRMDLFGPYEDAFRKPLNLDQPEILFHSYLSSVLNIGLLQPLDMVVRAETMYYENPDILSSVEGYIRQVMGWREYSRYLYLFEPELNQKNYLNNQNKLTPHWYPGGPSFEIDFIDDSIKLAWNTGYLHHIPRLMVIGNFMNLMSIHPQEMYRWFMEFSTDSYDWVMHFNVYSMISFADGGLTTTKPYISSSNYIKKMSNYSRNSEFDGLYYYFLDRHQDKLRPIGRMWQMYSVFDRYKSKDEKVEQGKKYMKSITGTLA
jgi:deoxyribodipyrimidine photolyase-related protein